MFGHLMIIHGGEGLKDTSKISEKLHGTSGICPGDSIQGTKLTPAVKVLLIHRSFFNLYLPFNINRSV